MTRGIALSLMKINATNYENFNFPYFSSYFQL